MNQISCFTSIFFLFFTSQLSYAEWKTLYQEDFEQANIFNFGEWQKDTFPDKDKYSENGSYFTNQYIKAVQGYRLSTSFGQAGWLSAESYSRDRCTDPTTLISIVSDPAEEDSTTINNKVMRLTSPKHTDATLIRSATQLTGRYRVSLKIGFPDFGSGNCLNGYDGDESAEPWVEQSAISENGFYWLAIADTIPRPHNNIWWHHHRKIVIDSDNHYPAWTEIWNSQEFITSGKNPVMMFVLDGEGKSDPLTGKPFTSFSNWQWHPPGQINAVDSYLPDQWYEVVIERNQNIFTLKISGHFAFGGYREYVASIDVGENCVWHYGRFSDQLNPDCVELNLNPKKNPGQIISFLVSRILIFMRVKFIMMISNWKSGETSNDNYKRTIYC